MKPSLFKIIPVAIIAAFSTTVSANDDLDLDDVKDWDMVKIETCLDAVLDTIPGEARKVELKLEGDDPVYEFDIEATADGKSYNVECNAEEGFVIEIEREVSANNATFKKMAKVSLADAKKTALAFHPGKVVATEYELGSDGDATYEFDIQSIHGYEVKVDVDASTGEIEEANIEIFEIGTEKE